MLALVSCGCNWLLETLLDEATKDDIDPRPKTLINEEGEIFDTVDAFCDNRIVLESVTISMVFGCKTVRSEDCS